MANEMQAQRAGLPGPALGEIASMVERRDKAKQLMDQALELIIEARSIAPTYTFEKPLRHMRWCADDYGIREQKEELKRALDRSCWNKLLDNTKLGVVMNSTQLEAFRSDVQKNAPELVLNRAMTTFMDLFVNQKETFRAGLVTAFQSLSGNYKSHSAFKVSKRSIIRNAISHHSPDYFSDIWKYLAILDGVDPSTVPHAQQPITIIRDDGRPAPAEFEFDQLRAVAYQNGNIHVWLDGRPDLLDKVNQLIAEHYGAALPNGRA